jgi:ubiquinone/menaquinone biosynthesis C-methylase UbiE
MSNKKTSWGQEAEWYDTLLSMDNTYQKDVILPNMIRLMDIHPGERVLDVACGQGFFSKAFAERGAEVLGVDISFQLIEIAKQKTGVREKYMVLPADKLSGNVSPKSYDKACIILALQNIENYQESVAEVARALKVGGKFYIVLNHPSFRIPKMTSWGWDEEKKVQYRRVDEYLSESRAEIEMHPGAKKESVTYSFHRPLQLYCLRMVFV